MLVAPCIPSGLPRRLQGLWSRTAGSVTRGAPTRPFEAKIRPYHFNFACRSHSSWAPGDHRAGDRYDARNTTMHAPRLGGSAFDTGTGGAGTRERVHFCLMTSSMPQGQASERGQGGSSEVAGVPILPREKTSGQAHGEEFRTR